MKFSVVTPVRNNFDKLRCCVGSVRGQHGVDIEHLVHDACSTDGAAEWLAQQNDLLSVSEPDDGMYDAINRGWSRATGEVFSWLNSDEQYLPGTLDYVSRFFSQHPEVDFVFGNALVVDEVGLLLAARREIRLSKLYIANGFLNAYSCTMFFRRRLFEDGSLKLDDDFKYAADMDLVLRLLSEGKRVGKLDKYLSAFTFDGTNLSCDQGMLDETAVIQSRYGGFQVPALRKLVSLGRYWERLISGSYRSVSVAYSRCVDDVPNYKVIEGSSVPGSYRTR